MTIYSTSSFSSSVEMSFISFRDQQRSCLTINLYIYIRSVSQIWQFIEFTEGIKILSVNNQVLADIVKRRDHFGKLRDMNGYIYCLEDNHFTPSRENDIKNLWGNKSYFS